MSREILFRAKRPDSREWVIGYFAVIGVKNAIIVANSEKFIAVDDGMKSKNGNEAVEVDPKTICQYTGLTDGDSNKIWENDILKVSGEDCYYKVIWDDDGAMFALECDSDICAFDYYWSGDLEVIGNLFDNPELLEGSEE